MDSTYKGGEKKRKHDSLKHGLFHLDSQQRCEQTITRGGHKSGARISMRMSFVNQ